MQIWEVFSILLYFKFHDLTVEEPIMHSESRYYDGDALSLSVSYKLQNRFYCCIHV